MSNGLNEIMPSDYWYCKQQLRELVNAYHSVNDRETITALQALISERVSYVFQSNSEFKRYFNVLMDPTLTRAQFDTVFDELLSFTQPMVLPTTKQIDKCFRKVKKMNYPKMNEVNPHALTYLGWNDAGTNKKFLVRQIEDTYHGLYGSFSSDSIKGHCAICNHISTVGFFLTTTKTSGDGTYTKKGNYICRNSNKCNELITDVEPLNQFWEIMSGSQG